MTSRRHNGNHETPSPRHVGLGHRPGTIYTRPPVAASPPPPLPTLKFHRNCSISAPPTATGPPDLAHAPRRAAMAELVPLYRGGDWRRRLREEEEVAVGVRGPLPRQGPADPWLVGNQNGLQPTHKSIYEEDQDNISTLLRSGRVNLNELLVYHTPELLLNQGEKIDPANVRITDIINDLARSRRSLLRMKLLKKKINVAECERLSKELSRWPVQVQELQGEVAELKGRYVRIPQILVDRVMLLS